MKRIKLLIELSYDDKVIQDPSPDGYLWFRNDVLGAKGEDGLVLWSNLIGSEIGPVKYLGVVEK